jgi:hypothetical protein
MITLKNKLIVLGACALLFAASIYVLLDTPMPGRHENNRVSEEESDYRSSEEIVRSSNARMAERDSGRYKNLYDRYAAGALANDPVSINKFISLTGACESVRDSIPGIKIPEEVKRMREFCALHVSNKGEIAYQLNELWQQSYSMKLKARFEELEKAAGKDAVGREISAELRSADAYQAQMALEYAANAGIIPEELNSVANKSDASLSKQLSILSHIEFCRGGACGGTDFEALSACVALPPCPSKLGLLEVIRRSSAPRDYEAALRMSEALQREH